jgi:hypothetical protein
LRGQYERRGGSARRMKRPFSHGLFSPRQRIELWLRNPGARGS